jgi:membrane protease YdiL (CAAX protease family)
MLALKCRREGFLRTAVGEEVLMEGTSELLASDIEALRGPGSKVQLVELVVFLFLIAPSSALSFFAVKQGNLSFVLVAVATILRDLGLVGLVLYFLWRNRERVARIGWDFRHRLQDVFIGLALFFPTFIAASGLERWLLSLGFKTPATPLPQLQAVGGIGDTILGVILVLIVAFAEETIFRGYLILRVGSLTSSSAAAVLISTAVFSLGHGYEGSAGIVTVAFLGLVFALVFLWRRSLVAAMTMHFLQDFLGIVLVPLLKLK